MDLKGLGLNQTHNKTRQKKLNTLKIELGYIVGESIKAKSTILSLS